MTFLIFGVRVRVSFLLAMGLCAAVLLPGRLVPLLAGVLAPPPPPPPPPLSFYSRTLRQWRLPLVSGASMQAKRAAAVHLSVAAATLFPLGNSDGAAIAANLLGRCRRLSAPARIWLRRGLAVLYFGGIMAAGGAFG